MQPTQSSMSRRMPSGIAPRVTTSDTAKRPPGFSTRNASRSTRSLSADRLMTQFEMITSTELSGSGICSISPLRNSTLVGARLPLVFARERQHLVGHVEAVGFAGGADAAGREQHVDAAARAEVEDRLALFEFGERGRVAAAERGQHRLFRQGAGFVIGVEIGGDRVRCRPAPRRAPQHEPGARTLRAASA